MGLWFSRTAGPEAGNFYGQRGNAMSKRDFIYARRWNVFLITAGSIIQAIGFKAVAIQHGFVPSGLFGVAALVNYVTDTLNAGIWFMILNVPMFVLAYVFITKRFLAYSFLAMIVTSVAFMLIDFSIAINDQLYAAVTFGVLAGTGAGIVLRSLGSNGGLDVIAVMLTQRYNIGIGKTYFFFNFILFSFSFASLDNDLVIASLIAAFVSSVLVEYTLSMFNQRKVCFIISDRTQEISDQIIDKLKISGTFLQGVGAYKKADKRLLMVVINNIQLKRLEEIVFKTDDYALFIVENTFSVIGSTFSRRKLY